MLWSPYIVVFSLFFVVVVVVVIFALYDLVIVAGYNCRFAGRGEGKVAKLSWGARSIVFNGKVAPATAATIWLWMELCQILL